MKRFLIILILLAPLLAQADITSPYTVDEKSQVLFGDSTFVNGHLGLENYAYDYIEGYLHVTFTYTHSRCCFASYPPRIYITDTDPRSTSTPLVKGLETIYELGAIPIPPGHETDWYLYDIQFDKSGYTVSVAEAESIPIANFHRDISNQKDSDWAALTNLYPMFIHLDGSISASSMSFEPRPIKKDVTQLPPAKPDPVIIIPGIMGSAYKNGRLVIDPILHTYDDLIATLKGNGYEEGKDLFTFPYEWRDSNALTAILLDEKISEVKDICGCNKVDIVAHSMGGLVARSYIQSAHYDNDVDQLIFLGTPHGGAPTSYLQWEAGQVEPSNLYNSLVFVFFEAEAIENGHSTIFSYIQSRPISSVQELLPISNYLHEKNSSLLRVYPNGYPRNLFLENLNANILHLINSGVKVTNITGDSTENKTIERIRVVPSTKPGLWADGEPEGFYTLVGDNGLERGAGDDTVPTSSSALEGVQGERVFASHNRIPTVVENRVVKLLTGKDSITSIDTGTNLDAKVLVLQLLSPIDMVVVAPDGQRIGKNFVTGEEFNEIPGAFYSGFGGDREFVTILNPLDGEYRIDVQGTDAGGEYGILAGMAMEATSTDSLIKGLTQPGQVTHITLDLNGTESAKNLVVERVVTLEVLKNDIQKSFELGWLKDRKLRDKWLKDIDKIIKKDDKGGTKKVDKRHAKILKDELNAYSKDKITDEAYDILKEDLDWLINN